jgi:lambda family phage portal protein
MDNTLRRRLVRVDAADVIHGYHARRPGQLRGISDFTPGILIAEDLSDLVESELECARLASRWLAFVTTPNMTGFQQDRIRRDDEGRRLEEVDDATIEYLRPGEEIKFNTGTRPGSTFEPFVQLLLRMIAVSVNVPYELLASDYRGLNFSNQKGVRSDWLKYLRPRQQRHCRWLLDPVFRDVLLQYALLQPRRLPVNMMSNMAAYMRHTWLPTGMESTDPLRETKANAEMVASGVMSPQEWCRSRGRDYEDVLREVADFQQLCTELGVSINNVSTALANNPAANGAPEDK